MESIYHDREPLSRTELARPDHAKPKVTVARRSKCLRAAKRYRLPSRSSGGIDYDSRPCVTGRD